jgi:diacylglycerol kinase (ATP)
MYRVAVIYNPALASMLSDAALITDVATVLHSAAIEVEVIPTESAGSVRTQAQQAICDGCDTILVCGGDGTVREVLQGVWEHQQRWV